MINTDNKLARLKANLPFIIILFGIYTWGTLKFYNGLTSIIALPLTIPFLIWFFVVADLKGFRHKTKFARNFALVSFTISWLLISTITWYFNLYGSSAQWAYTTITMFLLFIFAHIAADRKYAAATE